MNENILKKALIETADEMIFSEYSGLENTEFNPNEKFNKKIKKLCENSDKFTFKLTYTRFRKTVCLFVAILVLMLSSLSVGAVRDALASFFIKHFSNHAVVTYNEPTTKPNQYPKTIEKVYEIDSIPNGYSLIDCSVTDISVVTIYLSENGQIFLQQIVKDEYNANVDNENSIITNETINGKQYIVQKSQLNKDITFIWDNGEYIFSITSNLEKADIIDICENLKIKK